MTFAAHLTSHFRGFDNQHTPYRLYIGVVWAIDSTLEHDTNDKIYYLDNQTIQNM